MSFTPHITAKNSNWTRFICPTEARMDDDLFQTALAQLPEQWPKLRCFLLARDGKLVHESYYHDTDEHSLHDLRSATKSIMSLLIGIAQKQGKMIGTHDPIAPLLETFMPAPTRSNTLWQRLTLYHLLTMTTGLQWETNSRMSERWVHRFHSSPSWRRFATRLPIQSNMYGRFQYRSIDSHLLSVLLTLQTGMSADQFAAQYLFGPLGISNYKWERSPDGDAAGHIGLSLTGRDMLSIGQLLLNEGCVTTNNVVTSLIPASWVRETITAHSEGASGYGAYGYQWWCHQLNGIDAACAMGYGGQLIFVIPKLRITAVWAADSRVKRWRHPAQWLEQYLLPAVQP